jgi:chromosome partitioning protein
MLARVEFNGKRRRVLAIDYDPQFNMSQAFLPASVYFALEKARKTCLSILRDDETSFDPYVLQVPGNRNPPSVRDIAHTIHTIRDGRLDIIASTLDLMYIALGQPDKRIDAFEERFHKLITECRREYDVVVIDCHPAGSILTKTSLQNSDHVLIPVVSSGFAARGVALMRTFIDAVGKGNTGPIPHLLFNCTGAKASNDEMRIRGDARQSKYCLIKTLRKYKAFSDPSEGNGFVWSSGAPYSTKAYWNLHGVVEEVVSRTGM